jgi:hypothetical protein
VIEKFKKKAGSFRCIIDVFMATGFLKTIVLNLL